MSQTGMELAGETSEATAAAESSERVIDYMPRKVRKEKRLGWRPIANAVCVPVAAGVALAVHYALPDVGPQIGTGAYAGMLFAILGVGLASMGLRLVSPAMGNWIAARAPLFAGGVMLLCAWELVTAKMGWLPTMYFPGPKRVLQTLIDDRGELLNSAWHSLLLLFSGYALGVVVGVISGVTIGWSSGARYWGMPVLKILGPIPATAWIPMALIMFPRSMSAGVFLIALAVWFPVTMLSASGVSNVRASFLDVARTLGAGRGFLIFRVAIPAAMPSIFVGLFMGLGASFLTLLVAESTGVSAGLGFYIDWARNYSDYTKVFAALIIMAAFFSSVMTLLFKVRDRVLVWQKGTIKW